MSAPQIHPTALVDATARLGADVQIGPYSIVGPDCELGDGCRLDAHAVICAHTRLGPGCRLHSGSVIGDTPQDLAFSGVTSRTEIGARCTFREGVTVHRGTAEGTATRIGDDCYLMSTSHVAHNCVLGNRVILANGALLGGYAEIGDGAFLSGHCAVHQFCRVGRLAMMGGAAQISKDLPPFCTARSGSGNAVHGLNVVGLRRAGIAAEERTALKRAYLRYYRSGESKKAVLAALRESEPGGIVAEWVDFILASKRGVVGERRRGGESAD